MTSKDVLPEKDLLEKAASMKRFEYSPLSKELRAQTDIEKDKCKLSKGQMNVSNRNRGEEMSYESEVPKRLTQSEKTNFFGKTAKQISVKSCGSNNSLHPPIIKLLNERKTAFEKFYEFDELFEIFDEINNN